MRRLLPLLRIAPLRKVALRFADRQKGPGPEVRERARVELWGRATNARGDERTRTFSVAEGYKFTVLSSLAAVKGVLANPRPGAFTPAGYFGAELVQRIPGTEM